MNAHDAMMHLLAHRPLSQIKATLRGDGSLLRKMLQKEYLSLDAPSPRLDSLAANEQATLDVEIADRASRTWRQLTPAMQQQIVDLLNDLWTDSGDDLAETMLLHLPS